MRTVKIYFHDNNQRLELQNLFRNGLMHLHRPGPPPALLQIHILMERLYDMFLWRKNEAKLKWFIMKGLLIGFDGFILLYGRDLLLV